MMIDDWNIVRLDSGSACIIRLWDFLDFLCSHSRAEWRYNLCPFPTWSLSQILPTWSLTNLQPKRTLICAVKELSAILVKDHKSHPRNVHHWWWHPLYQWISALSRKSYVCVSLMPKDARTRNTSIIKVSHAKSLTISRYFSMPCYLEIVEKWFSIRIHTMTSWLFWYTLLGK